MAIDAIEEVRTKIQAAIEATAAGHRRELVAAVVTVMHDTLSAIYGRKPSRYVSWDTPGQVVEGTFVASDWLLDYRGVRQPDGHVALFPISAKQLRAALAQVPDGADVHILYLGTGGATPGTRKSFYIRVTHNGVERAFLNGRPS